MSIKIALAGNPNSGKTTLFNSLTGSNQFVGNWPGVTVEKKEGKYKNNKDVIITDLPGIYSLSPYTLEEVVARNYLLTESPDVILNIVDGTNLERNLYLTTQLIELGIPVVVAINMMDVVNRNGDKININQLSKELGCEVATISALKGTGIIEAAETAIDVAKKKTSLTVHHKFSGSVEHAIAHIEEAVLHDFPEEKQRWYAIKLFERDEKIIKQLNIDKPTLEHIEIDIEKCEDEMDDDAESIITNERYLYIASIIGGSYTKKNKGKLTTTDKIDRVVTNRFAALPIFAVVMFLLYFVSITTVGGWATDWANDGVFGDGWHLFGIGSSHYREDAEAYAEPEAIIKAFEKAADEKGIEIDLATALTTTAYLYDDEGNSQKSIDVNYSVYKEATEIEEPDPGEYGVWISGVPVLVEKGLNAINSAQWLSDLILNGIVSGVGAVLGFVPQMFVLFLLLAFLEACGYMARVAFILDRIFRKFGLSGKSFIPMLIGTGCGVPGIMASRTIENDRDRKMTIITTTFIPCGAKLPIIALISGAMFGGAWCMAPSAYFIGILAIVVSGIILKKTKLFAGDPAPFVMELPTYHWPTVSNVLRSMWERGWSFIKKAGTIILLATIFVWFTSSYGWENGKFAAVTMDESILAVIGNIIAPVFAPLGWGHWQGAVSSIAGLIAKENVVGTFGVFFGGFDVVAENGWQIWNNMRTIFTPLSAFSFLIFNLLCAPCFAAMGAIKREMNSAKWTAFAITYQCVFAYVVSLCIYQIGNLILTGTFEITTACALAVLTLIIYMLFRPASSVSNLKKKRS